MFSIFNVNKTWVYAIWKSLHFLFNLNLTVSQLCRCSKGLSLYYSCLWPSFKKMQHKHKNVQCIVFFRLLFLFLCAIFQFSCSDVWSRQCLPLTTQENFTFEFSDTAFDFRVASKDGCVSSVKWAITLQSVLLTRKWSWSVMVLIWIHMSFII